MTAVGIPASTKQLTALVKKDKGPAMEARPHRCQGISCWDTS